MHTRIALCLLVLVLLAPTHPGPTADEQPSPTTRPHYIEFVCKDVQKQCAALEQMHGLTFGPPVADLGQARVAETTEGTLIGVRAPLAEHEQPIIRTYFEVQDINEAVKTAVAAGAMIAYPPTRQGDTGSWAVYFLGELQQGLWQK